VFDTFKETIGKADQESFWAIGYDGERREIYRECLFLGGTSSTTVCFRIIFRRLVAAGVAAWVSVHNHPTGNTQPSKEDMETAFDLKAASELLGITYLDNIIIGEGFLSFKDRGFMDEKKKADLSSSEKIQAIKKSDDRAAYRDTLTEQYLSLKRGCPDAILVFVEDDGCSSRTFFDDAENSSKVLGFPVKRIDGVPECVIPSYKDFTPRLVKAGFKVAICKKDPLGPPGKADCQALGPKCDQHSKKRGGITKYMKALSIREPWASMFLAEGEARKSIDIRTWRTNYRGPILLCATAKPKGPLSGQAFAIGELADVVPMTSEHEARAKGKCKSGAHAWIFSKVTRIDPFPVKGQQGLCVMPSGIHGEPLPIWNA
jgi:DNA repair protein RadC